MVLNHQIIDLLYRRAGPVVFAGSSITPGEWASSLTWPLVDQDRSSLISNLGQFSGGSQYRSDGSSTRSTSDRHQVPFLSIVGAIENDLPRIADFPSDVDHLRSDDRNQIGGHSHSGWFAGLGSLGRSCAHSDSFIGTPLRRVLIQCLYGRLAGRRASSMPGPRRWRRRAVEGMTAIHGGASSRIDHFRPGRPHQDAARRCRWMLWSRCLSVREMVALNSSPGFIRHEMISGQARRQERR